MEARTVRYPIAMFVMAALAVIAIGVGVVAAVTNPNVYGPSWGRFSAAFTGHVYESQEHSTVRVSGGRTRTLTLFSYSNQPHSGWYAYSPQGTPGVFGAYDRYSISVEEGMPVRLLASGDKKAFFGPGVTEDDQSANGFSLATIGPECSDGECNAAEVMSNGRVVWNVEAFWEGPRRTIASFLASFEPIG
jgi:hypothetical protein